MIDPNKVTQAVMEFMQNPTWKEIFTNAPGGAMERLAISFYFSKFHDDFKPEDFEVTLPKNQKKITLKMQTPRMLDEIEKETEDFKSKNPDSDLDMSFLYTLKHSIEYVDGVHYDPIKMEAFLRKLPMADTNVLIQKTVKIIDKVGIDTSITEKCDSCGSLYDATFRINSEFFGPTID